MQDLVKQFDVKKGEKHYVCPFCSEERLIISHEKNVFKCTGCDAQGNVLDFAAKKLDVSVKAAAEYLAKQFTSTKAKATDRIRVLRDEIIAAHEKALGIPMNGDKLQWTVFAMLKYLDEQ